MPVLHRMQCKIIKLLLILQTSILIVVHIRTSVHNCKSKYKQKFIPEISMSYSLLLTKSIKHKIL